MQAAWRLSSKYEISDRFNGGAIVSGHQETGVAGESVGDLSVAALQRKWDWMMGWIEHAPEITFGYHMTWEYSKSWAAAGDSDLWKNGQPRAGVFHHVFCQHYQRSHTFPRHGSKMMNHKCSNYMVVDRYWICMHTCLGEDSLIYYLSHCKSSWHGFHISQIGFSNQ